MKRENTKRINVGGVVVGGGAKVSVQSMCNTKTWDAEATAAQIREFAAAGCDIVRVAVPDMRSAQAISEIKERVDMPLVADIHFDYRLALEAAARGADKIRINPGNIGSAGARGRRGQGLRPAGDTDTHRRQRRQPGKAHPGEIRCACAGG